MKVYILIETYTETFCSPYPDNWDDQKNILGVYSQKGRADQMVQIIRELAEAKASKRPLGSPPFEAQRAIPRRRA